MSSLSSYSPLQFITKFVFLLVSPRTINSVLSCHYHFHLLPGNQSGQRPIVSFATNAFAYKSQFIIGQILSQSTCGLKDWRGNTVQLGVFVSNNSLQITFFPCPLMVRCHCSGTFHSHNPKHNTIAFTQFKVPTTPLTLLQRFYKEKQKERL